MKVRELIQDLLLVDPMLEVMVYRADTTDATEPPVPVHTWDYEYDDEDDGPIGILLLPVH